MLECAFDYIGAKHIQQETRPAFISHKHRP